MRRGLDQALDDFLVLLAQGGSRNAAARLAARWTPRLLAFAARTLGNPEAARNAVQDTWESVLRGLSRLDDPARFGPWLFTIAGRKCTDALRARYRDRRVEDAVAADSAMQDAAGVGADASLDLARALKRLPAEQRVAVSLFFGEAMNVADIAAATGVPIGTVKSRLFAARKVLRASIGEGK